MIRFLRNIFHQENTNQCNLPKKMMIALSNNCNYSCPICSVHSYEKNGIKKVNNSISLDEIERMSTLMEDINSISFMGLYGESLTNSSFCEIAKYLKSLPQNPCLHVQTNGFALSESIIDNMINMKFDTIGLSLHATTKETYAKLQGKHFEKVLGNIKNLNRLKALVGSAKPHITVFYALNKLNIDEAVHLIDIAIDNNISRVNIYHYNDYGWNEIALDCDPETANKKIDKIYEYANALNATQLLPQNPPYFKKICETNFDLDDYSSDYCDAPFKNVCFRSSYSHPDSLYAGVCNVYNAFLYNYKFVSNPLSMWNHPILNFLRQTVNEDHGNKRNALCAYCKSPLRKHLKHVNNALNYKIKLEKIDLFMKEFSHWNSNKSDIYGLTPLTTEDKELRSLV